MDISPIPQVVDWEQPGRSGERGEMIHTHENLCKMVTIVTPEYSQKRGGYEPPRRKSSDETISIGPKSSWACEPLLHRLRRYGVLLDRSWESSTLSGMRLADGRLFGFRFCEVGAHCLRQQGPENLIHLA